MGVFFYEVKASGLTTLEQVRKEFGCTTQCGMCQPYIERMLVTGETEFEVLPSHVTA
jgi:NAD(P)H-nitrite reductase large subunit